MRFASRVATWALLAACVAVPGVALAGPSASSAASPAAAALPFGLTLANLDGATSAPVTVGVRLRVGLKPGAPGTAQGIVESVRFENLPGDAEADWALDADWTHDLGKQDDASPASWHATVRPFATGLLTLPVVSIRHRDAAGGIRETRLTSVTLSVASVLGNATAYKPFTLRGLAAAPFDWRWPAWLAGALALAGLIGAGAWAWRRRRAERPAAPPEPQLPPGLWALRELEARSRQSACQSGPAKTIFTMVSEVMRLYLERRYGVPAIDLTTTECLLMLQAKAGDAEALGWLRLFLNECDLIKFSRFEAPRERWATIWNDAKSIVRRTTPPEEFADAGATTATAASPPASSGGPSAPSLREEAES
jgi:hypothetical protein